MPTKQEFLNYVNSLAGTWNDVDGAYGAQCVDLINQVYEHFWNFKAWGNAIDFCRNQMPEGFARYLKGQVEVQPGDILVWKWSNSDRYGHVSICVETNGNTIKSLDQNVDGTPSQGGVARYRTRDDTHLVAILRPPFSEMKYGWIQDSTGWWYRNNDGSYPKETWQLINNLWYYFNSNGYAVTGWQQIKYGGSLRWFYFDLTRCHMLLGWQFINWNGANRWFYFERSGAMASGVYELEWAGVKKLYAFDSNGCLIQNSNGLTNVYANPDGSLIVKGD